MKNAKRNLGGRVMRWLVVLAMIAVAEVSTIAGAPATPPTPARPLRPATPTAPTAGPAVPTGETKGEVQHGVYVQLIREGRLTEAARVIGEWLRKSRELGAADVARLGCYRARVLRLQEKPAEAVKALDGMAMDGREKGEIAALWAYERGAALMALEKYDAAEAPLRTANGATGVMLKTPAMLELARWTYQAKHWQACIQLCNGVIGAKSPNTEDQAELAAWKKGATELRELAEEQWLIEQFSADYLHYRKGREAQAARQWDAALTQYGLVSHGVLRDAAQCYTISCLFATGKEREAEKAAKGFIESDRLGLYRGEVRLMLARRHFMESRGNESLKRVLAELNDLESWQADVLANPGAVSLEELTPVLKNFPVPPVFTRKDDLGALVRVYAGPETVVNRLTSPWYLADQRMEALLLKSLVGAEMGEVDAARTAVAQLNGLNAANGGQFMIYSGVADGLVADIERGAFLVDAKVWHRFSARYERRLQWACFQAVAERSAAAQAAFEAMLSEGAAGAKNELNRDELTAVHYGIAVCAFQQGKVDRAIQELSLFVKELRTSPMRDEALLMLANLLAGKVDRQADADALYEKLGADSDAEFAAKVRFSQAVFAVNTGRNELAVKLCESITKRQANTAYAKPAANLLARLVSAEGAVLPGLPRPDGDGFAPAVGRMVDVRRSLIFPGGGDLAVNYKDMTRRDLLRYSVSASTAADCVILRSFSLRFTRYEPQVQPIPGHHGEFIRAPALYDSMLWRATSVEPPEALRGNADNRLLTWEPAVNAMRANGKLPDAERYLRNLLANGQVPKKEATIIRVVLASVLREQGTPQKALDLLNALPKEDQAVPRVRLEQGLDFLALKRFKEAEEMLRLSINDAHPEVADPARLAFAQVMLATNRSQEAVAWLRQVARSDDRTLVDVALPLLETAQVANLTDSYGASYMHYVLGSQALEAHRYAAAIAHFGQCDAGMVGDAARVAAARAMAANGDRRQAVNLLEKLVADSNSTGLYRGEALLELAEMQVCVDTWGDGTLRAAQRRLTDARDWLATKTAPPTGTLADGAKAAAASDQTAAQQARIAKDFPAGDRYRAPGTPGAQAVGTLINPRTATWYLPQFAVRLSLLETFLAQNLKQDSEALQALSRVDKALTDLGLDPSQTHVRLLAGLRAGAFVLPASEADRLDRRVRGQIAYGLFLYTAGSRRQAERLFREVLAPTSPAVEQPDLGYREQAAAQLGLALCLRDNKVSAGRETALPPPAETGTGDLRNLLFFLQQVNP